MLRRSVSIPISQFSFAMLNPVEVATNTVKGVLANLLLWVWKGIVKYSYWLCLLTAIAGLIYYCFGNKKGARWSKTALASYLLIKIIDSVIK
jgi:hypothetical protein